MARERVFLQTHGTESRCVTGPEHILFLRRVRGSFSSDILQAGVVKGLATKIYSPRYSNGRAEGGGGGLVTFFSF